MLNDFRKTLKQLVASPKVRADLLRVRCQLERLEGRAMLSASHGTMPHVQGGQEFGPRGDGLQRFSETAAISSFQQQALSVNAQSYNYTHSAGDSYGMSQGYPMMQPALQAPPRSSAIQQRPTGSSVNQSFVSPPQSQAISYHGEPGSNSYVPPAPTGEVYDLYLVTQTPQGTYVQYVGQLYSGNSTPQHVIQKATSPVAGAIGGDIDPGKVFGGGPPDHSELRAPPGTGNQFISGNKPIVGSNNPLGDTLPYVSNLVGTNSELADIPSATQILTRETGAVGALAAVARDLAFQDFSSKLLQANASTSYGPVAAVSLSADPAQSDAVSGLIQPSDESMIDEIVSASDVVVREREAVDAVLRDLHDVDSLLPAAESADVTFQIDLQPDSAIDEMLAGEMDGGMVLIRATGDANDGGIDLTPVYARQVERFTAPAKMEASVGMFQAIDVVTDEASLLDAAPQMESTRQFKTELQSEDKVPTKREQSSSKAAAVIGAATLTGALVWMNRAGSPVKRPKPTAKKSRASRS